MKLIFLLSALLIINIARSQTGFTASIVDQANTEAIPCFGKLEIAVALPEPVSVQVRNFLSKAKVKQDQKLNPFMEWDIDIEALFVHESGKTQKIDAFYYRDYERDTVSNLWRDLRTDKPFRIRFAPPLTGKWTAALSVKIKGQTQDISTVLTFNVVESGNPGNIHVHSNNRNLALADSIIYPVGVNFPSPIKKVRVYHTGSADTPETFAPEESARVTRLHEWMAHHKDIEAYHKTGGKYIRILQTGWSSLIEFEEKGNYYERQPYAWEQDRLLEYCENNGMYVFFDLMQQEPIMKFANYYMGIWDFSQYSEGDHFYYDSEYPSYAYSGNKKIEAWKMFLDEQDLKYHEQRMRYYISRYGYSTSVTMFEILSEPWHLNQHWPKKELYTDETPEGDTVRMALRNYHTRMAKFIKQDMERKDHLIGIEVYGSVLFDGKFIDSSAFSPDVDVLSFNPYSNNPDKLLISKSTSNNKIDNTENSMYRSVHFSHENFGKPLLIAEGGPGDSPPGCDDDIQWQMDMVGFGFTGIASFNSWKGWFYGQDALWPLMVTTQNFFNSPEMKRVLEANQGNWINGRQAENVSRKDNKALKELQYYLSGDKLAAAGYVKNRTANIPTMRKNDLCLNSELAEGSSLGVLTDISWDAGTKELYVDGLKQGKTYTVKWIDALTGKTVLETKQRLNRRKFILKFPELKVTDPADFHPQYWFVINSEL